MISNLPVAHQVPGDGAVEALHGDLQTLDQLVLEHMGAGTGPYAFVWGMTGENQEYNDVAPVALAELK